MGEDAAKRHLENLGYRIVQANYRDKQGEADIVAYDGEVLVFAEVKTRKSTRYGTPGEAVNREKQRRLTRIALSYIARHKVPYRQVRFDVVEVIIKDSEVKQVRLIKDAFDAWPGY
ncbi:MAG: YraN family protein [Clostridiales bacterium]|jgi:putative endonuclease|nr:YraN family protein [Clostridiales bacterium]